MEKPNCMRELRWRSYRKDQLELFHIHHMLLMVINRVPAHVRAGEQRRELRRRGLQRHHHVVEAVGVVEEVEPVQSNRRRLDKVVI